MKERLDFVLAVDREPDEAFVEICRRFSISAKTGYKWMKRYVEGGALALFDEPPIALKHPRTTAVALVDTIVALRKKHPTWGPKKLRARLAELSPFQRWPASSTFGEILKRQGLIRPRRRRQLWSEPRTPSLTVGEEPNDVWAIDFKGHFALRDGARCHPLTLTDDRSRYLLCCEGLPCEKEGLVRDELERVFVEFGLPRVLRSDNGVPFSSRGVGGLTDLTVWLIQLGIRLERIAPGHPEENGRHERMHRTLKAEASPQSDMATQQRVFDRFRAIYNDERPHEALGQKAPARFYRASARRLPALTKEPTYDSRHIVRKANPKGQLRFFGGHISVGAALKSRKIGLVQVNETWWQVSYGTHLLGFADESKPGSNLKAELPSSETSGPPLAALASAGLAGQPHPNQTPLPEDPV